MNNRTMATVYVNQDSISVKTCSRKGCSPQRFIILKKELQRLEEKKYLITKDIHSYAELAKAGVSQQEESQGRSGESYLAAQAGKVSGSAF